MTMGLGNLFENKWPGEKPHLYEDRAGAERIQATQVEQESEIRALEREDRAEAMRIRAAYDVWENEIPLHEDTEAARRREHEAALEQMQTDKLRLEIQLAKVQMKWIGL